MTTDTLVSSAEKSVLKPGIAFTKSVHPERLDQAGREALLDELLTLNRQIFDGPGVQPVSEAIAKGSLAKTTVQLYFNAEGRCVGFAALLCDEFEQDGKPWSVFRAMAGLLPEYRKQQRVLGFFISTLAAYALRNPRRRVFFFTPIAHISSYRLVARHALEMYPHPDHPVPPKVMEMMQRLGARYSCTPVEGEHPLVCRRSLWVRGGTGAHARRSEQGDAFDRFFQQINPRVSEGLCVMALAPLTLGNLLTGAFRYARTRASVLLRQPGHSRTEGVKERAA